MLIFLLSKEYFVEKKILWVSPYSLHDTSSGAAIQCRTMLECLAKEGIKVLVLGSFCFDSPRGTTYFPKLEEELKARGTQPVILNDKDNNITYHYTVCASRAMSVFTHDEAWRFYMYYCALLNSFRPDIVIGYGMGTCGIAVQAEAKRRGIPFVYPICNGNHPHYDFNDCALLLTESKATAQLYATRDRMNVIPCGIFIRPEKYIAQKRDPKYITLVNPDPTKGISIFAKLALKAHESGLLQQHNLRFLVVQSRGTFEQSLAKLHAPDSKECPYKPEMFPFVALAQHTGDMASIYAVTRVLLAPSLWYESWGRVATEAALNGIPCIVSTSGGLKEAMGDVGIAVQAPQECHKDHCRIPTDAEIAPWLDALAKVLARDWNEEAKRARETFSLANSTRRVLDALAPLFALRAGSSPHIIRSGNLRMKIDGSF